MLPSPLDSHDDDDFSHLPTVDGHGPPPSQRPAKNLPLAEAPLESTSPHAEGEPEAPYEPADESAPSAGDEATEPASLEAPLIPASGDHPATERTAEPPADSPSQPEAGPDFPAILPVEPADHEEPADNRGEILSAKKKAVIWATSLHLLALLLLGIVQVVPAPQPVSEIIAIGTVETQVQPTWKKVAPPSPTASGGPSIQPIVAMGTSDVAMPDVDFTPTATELNVGSSFGSFGSGSGTGGGSVTFMGNQGKGSRVVFVVDVSGSMSATSDAGGSRISRFELLKKELAKSLNQLRGGVQYQILYFSDFAWPHDEVDTNDPKAMAKYEWDIRPGQQNVRIPRYRYLVASPSNLTRSKKIVDESVNPGGTNWGSGLLMALGGTPKPDLIFFMTDGNKSDALTWVDEVTAANSRGKRTTIHTTAMMEPGAAKDLDDLARRNGGKFTVVMADGKVVKGDDFFKSAAN